VLSEVPIWVLHSDANPVAPIENSRVLAAMLRACGGTFRLTVYPGIDHFQTADAAFSYSALTDWRLRHAPVSQ
jgi:predicted peptidase